MRFALLLCLVGCVTSETHNAVGRMERWVYADDGCRLYLKGDNWFDRARYIQFPREITSYNWLCL